MKIIALISLLPAIALAQFNADTSTVTLSGAGSSAVNGTYHWNASGNYYSVTGGCTNVGYYTNNTAGSCIYYLSGSWLALPSYACGLGPNYSTTNFPATWTVSGATAPAPTGSYGLLPTATNWTSTTTNYWAAPGDRVYFRALGRNLSSGANSNKLVVLFGGTPVFTGPWTQGAGFAWNLDGKAQWDGTNLFYSATFNSGDTNTPLAIDAGLIANAAVTTNGWQWCVLGDTNGLIFDAASISAARSPSGDVPTHSFIVPQPLQASAGVVYAPLAWSLFTITNGMPDGGVWQGNSNNSCLVTLSLSNGVVRYLQVLR